VERQSDIFQPGEFADHPPSFDLFWREYPKRRGKRLGKSAALRLWCRLKPQEQCEALEAARNYAKSDIVRRDFARDACRFLAADWWRDWLEGPGTPEDERTVLIEELKKHRGKKRESGEIISTGIAYMHADVTWSTFSLEELRRIVEELR
jgi:hypothetical protein